jgi:hypothetical protein
MTFYKVAPSENMNGSICQTQNQTRRRAYDPLARPVHAMTGTGAVLILIAATAVRRRRDLLDQAFVGITCGSLLSFSVAMAVTDVLDTASLIGVRRHTTTG